MNFVHHPRCPMKPYEGMHHYAGPMPPCYCQQLYTQAFQPQQRAADPQINLSKLTELMQALKEGRVERVDQNTTQEIAQLKVWQERDRKCILQLREERDKLAKELGKWKMKRHNTLLTLRSFRERVKLTEDNENFRLIAEIERLKCRLGNAEAMLRGGR